MSNWFARTFDAGANSDTERGETTFGELVPASPNPPRSASAGRITAPVPLGTDAVVEPAPVASAETFGPDLVPIWSDATKLRVLQGF
jgi:hypothetical protein